MSFGACPGQRQEYLSRLAPPPTGVNGRPMWMLWAALRAVAARTRSSSTLPGLTSRGATAIRLGNWFSAYVPETSWKLHASDSGLSTGEVQGILHRRSTDQSVHPWSTVNNCTHGKARRKPSQNLAATHRNPPALRPKQRAHWLSLKRGVGHALGFSESAVTNYVDEMA